MQPHESSFAAVVDASDVSASELELCVLTKMELGRISLQQHHSRLATEYHLSAAKLLQNSALLSGNKTSSTSTKKRYYLWVSLCSEKNAHIFLYAF